MHVKEHEELEQLQSKQQHTQQRIEAAFKKREKLPDDHPTAKRITEKVIYFIVLDDQPLSVVENTGFRSLIEYIQSTISRAGKPFQRNTSQSCSTECRCI